MEALLSEPTESTVRSLDALEGDIVILGVGGKMGPTLARMAKRASEAAGVKRRVIGVSRFSSVGLERRLQSWGVETIQCDLLDRASVNALPDVANVVFMAGMKFGSATQDARMTCSTGVSASQMMIWIADWVCRGGSTLAKPMHFEERSGRF